ncbi:MAG: hypothetical protein Q9195_002629 [Heterodermia aff. obscurata]
MYDVDHPVYPQLQAIGKEITKAKPKAVVVFSAHWQANGSDRIEINSQVKTDLLYDFYGFPSHYYRENFPNVGSKEIAYQVIESLESNGIVVSPVSRGLDHGVWACFKVAFDAETNPLEAPVVQVSLYSSSDPYQHYNLGKAVSALREQNIQFVVSGMAVHNLRDMRFAMGNPNPLPYTVSFDEALKEAVTGSSCGRADRMAQLLKRPDAKRAHPTLEHLLPIFVGAGAAAEDEGTRLWTLTEGSVSWACYRFGNLPVA